MAALVAPTGRSTQRASRRLETGPLLRKAGHSLLRSVDGAYWGEEVCLTEEQTAATRQVTWLPTGQLPGDSSSVSFICLFTAYFLNRRPGTTPMIRF